MESTVSAQSITQTDILMLSLVLSISSYFLSVDEIKRDSERRVVSMNFSKLIYILLWMIYEFLYLEGDSAVFFFFATIVHQS